MEKGKKKKSLPGRKKRLQLDDNEESYSRNNTNCRSPESSTSRKNSASSRSAAVSFTGSTVDSLVSASISRASSSSASVLPATSVSTQNASMESKNNNEKTPPSNENRSNPTSDNVAATSSTPRPGSTSPDPNCAICLGKLENKSFTDSCFHQFCFVCLVEWSKVKAECPLCKQSFRSIVHNVRSYDDYDQYHIPTPEERNPVHELGLSGIRFRYRTTVTDHRYATLADRINREIESRLLQRPSRSLPIPSYRRLRQPANSEFRRSVYLQRLKLNSQQLNTRRRVRETSPTFFRDNPAQTHRLVPWLNRELNALLQGHGEQTAFVLDLIMGLIKRFPIDSEEFYQHVYPYIGRHTRQFMHEFLMFAKSPYHMAAYDRHSSYGPSEEPHHDSDSDSDYRTGAGNDGNDSDVIVVSPGNSPVPENRNNQPPPPRREDSNLDDWERSILTAGDPYFHRFAPIIRTYRNEDLPSMHPYAGLRPDDAPTSASGWDSPTPGPSQLRLHIPYLDQSSSSTDLTNSRFSGGSIWTPSSRSFSAPTTQPLPSTSSIFGNLMTDSLGFMPRLSAASSETDPSMPQGDPVVSDANSSDIEIVEVEKPWNERSPIHVSSGGETDFEVMITGTTHVNDPVKTEKKKKKHKRRHDESSAEQNKVKRKRARERSSESLSKKKRHKSKSGSAERYYRSQSRSRTRSLSPVRLRIFRAPDYQHKKFAYKTHSDRSDRMLENNKSRSVSRSRSFSSLDSDTEAHVSITSHRRSSKSKLSSIEIVEYCKKSSKSKKNKKHKKNKGKDKDVERNSEVDKPHKHKKHSESVYDYSSSELYGKHKKHKHKSKKKKHHKEKNKTEEGKRYSLSLVGDNSAYTKRTTGACIYTSDSEPDSVSENEEKHITDRAFSEHAMKSPTFTSQEIDFVKLDSAQAASIDKELESINKTLAKNDYINSLLEGDSIGQKKDATEKGSKESGSIGSLNEDKRSFKKHPYGHKKSGKSVQQKSPVSAADTNMQVEYSNLINQVSSPNNSVRKSEDNIQSHDISSCTDIDFERQLPSFLTFSNRNADSNIYQDTLHLSNSQNSDTAYEERCATATASYDSPTSSGLISGREKEKALSLNSEDDNFVDVDTISDDSDSDINITGEIVPIEKTDVVNYRSCANSLITPDTDNFIDVVGESDDEQVDQTHQNADKTDSDLCSNNGNSQGWNSANVEDDDSDIECSLVEGHKTFEIAEDSDCEMKSRGSPDIDVIDNSDDEGMIDAVKRMNNDDLCASENLPSLISDAVSDRGLAGSSANADILITSPVVYNTANNRYEVVSSESDNESFEISVDDGKSPMDETRIESSSQKEQGSDAQGNGTDKWINTCDNNKDEENKFEQNITDNLTLDTSTGSFKSSTSAAERNQDATISGAPGVVSSEHSSNFTWTANSLYEARPLLMTNQSNIGGLSGRNRSLSDQDYIVNLPSDRTPSWEMDTPGSPGAMSSPDSNQTASSPRSWSGPSPNSDNGDFLLPED